MVSALSDTVRTILSAVERRGDAALIEYTRRFDGVRLAPSGIAVPARARAAIAARLDRATAAAIRRAAANVRAFNRAEKRRCLVSWKVRRGGLMLGQTVLPVDAVGIYVPGGRYAYPSTVLMTALCARTAGVRRVVMVTPPRNITPAVLYAAAVSGVDAVYRVGGAQAIGALAYGTATVPRVDLIVGPGNAYVNEAKRQVFGRVGIDALAGPSEVAIIADASAPVSWVVEDLLAQVEHDPAARARLFTDSAVLAAAVRVALPAPVRRQVLIERCALSRAAQRVTALAPEHVELLVARPAALRPLVRAAGAVFAGYAAPTALGDYWAGPSHVLPTGGSARFASGLSVATFLRRTSDIIAPAAVRGLAAAARLADAEGLRHHAASLRIRSER